MDKYIISRIETFYYQSGFGCNEPYFYKTSDGKHFQSLDRAITHEKMIVAQELMIGGTDEALYHRS